MILSQCVYHKKILGNTAAGVDAAAVTGDAIDVTTLGAFDRARLIIELGAVVDGAKLTASLSECDTSAGTYTTIADLGAAGMVITDMDDNSVVIDVPLTERYLKYGYRRTTQNAEFDSLVIELYDSGKTPITQSATVAIEKIL